jgi:hypothetical protein
MNIHGLSEQKAIGILDALVKSNALIDRNVKIQDALASFVKTPILY